MNNFETSIVFRFSLRENINKIFTMLESYN